MVIIDIPMNLMMFYECSDGTMATHHYQGLFVIKNLDGLSHNTLGTLEFYSTYINFDLGNEKTH